MKKLIFLLFAVLGYATAVSQVDSVTYGISAFTQDSGLYLSRINDTNGIVTKISSHAAAGVPGAYGRTIDPVHHVFYYATESDLLAFDLNTGEQISEVPITNYMNSTFQGMNYDYSDSTIYGIAVDVTGLNIKLAKLDLLTGSVIPISDSSLATSYNGLTGTTLDPVHGVFYFETRDHPSNRLIGVDLYTGGMVSDPIIGLDSLDRFGPMEYNCHDSTLYGLAGNFTHGRKLVTVNPNNGSVTFISLYNIADTILNEQVTIDPFQRVLYFESLDHSYRGVSMNSGYLVAFSYITPLPGSYFTGFLFNHTCYFHSPSFIVENQQNPELTLFPNPVTNKLNIRSSVPLIKIEIIDFTGKSVLSENCYGLKEIQADLSRLPEGIYIVRINREGTVVSSKFIKASPGLDPGQ